ncbi:GTP cyclohydrolase FolE2 [Actinoplanes sichuanensis]|uniref:GTP cyclohydrolase FolE2 n=1 Tax=Actinoplanes sichuanensis TaxID=512349 RepID=A0ABW4AK39_9ACTN|nr:GTP cyclohydrolase FolE2 [Actinoplanes sichuanensis]BEL10803.1 GTP cyclohydrolase FolE2 [Actinoplanes sichuanensis]
MLPDVQGMPDQRGVALDDVGIEGLRYPLLVADAQGAKRETVATVDMAVSLDANVKGAHLSRFVEVLHAWRDQLAPDSALRLVEDLRTRMGSGSARVHLAFAYFLERQAPVTGARSFSEYQCALTASVSTGDPVLTLGVRVPVTSVCPCSKAISDRGAHNQRGYVTIEAHPAAIGEIWFDDLIAIAEASASSPVYALLKRPDERHVTMAGYDNPVFVEDMTRQVALALRDDPRVAQFRVRVVNDESIHNHAAYAQLGWNDGAIGGAP